MRIFFDRCRLLDGLSWSALALVAAFCAVQAFEWVLSPMSGVYGGDAAEMAEALLSRFWVFAVTGFTMLITALLVLNAAGRAGRESPAVAVVAVIAACVAAAVTRYAIGATPASEGAAFMLLVFVSWLAAGAILVGGYVYFLRAQAAQEEARGAQLRREALETQNLATRLRLLQAQVEPHFIFNTLANVRRLCQSDAAAGRAMLAQLARYLRAALPRMRENEARLADEIELVSAYLGVQKVRMGERLQVTIDVAAPLLETRVPSMMLATLAENAIKHGIAPLSEGGSISITAVSKDNCLVLSVADSGRGFAAESGSGVGLANIRARLAALYGGGASLRLEGNAPRGVVATITLPMTGNAA
jgi:signal transduction histidine kinase